MKHQKIQKKFLLYFDGDLSEVEKILIDQHLEKCTDCKRHFEELVKIWNEEKTLGKPLPSQALWYDLKDRMEKVQVSTNVGNVKLLFNTAISFFVIVFAVFIGSRFGSALSTQSETYVYSENIQDEFGMSYFDAVPPNTIGKDIFISPANNKGMKK